MNEDLPTVLERGQAAGGVAKLGTSALCSRPGLQTKQPAAKQQKELNIMPLAAETENHRLGEGLGCSPAA